MLHLSLWNGGARDHFSILTTVLAYVWIDAAGNRLIDL